MKFPLITAGVLAGAGIGIWLAFGAGIPTPETAAHQPSADGALVSIELPDTHSRQALSGKRAFETVCADCHGENAVGRDGAGPPLVHKIYEPSHHGDMSFQLAVRNGVRAHHWSFGNMPPQDGLTRGDVADITTYVRELQRANGIN